MSVPQPLYDLLPHHKAAHFDVKCARCRYSRRGVAELSAQVAAAKHSVMNQGHRVTITYEKRFISSHYVEPKSAVSDDELPF